MASVAMTHARAVALLTELVEAFSRKTFQKRLGKLAAKHGDVWTDLSPCRPIRHMVGRRDLVFKAQRDVLLRYGFSADEEGILGMKTALRAHLADPTVAGLSREARMQLRIPQMTMFRASTTSEDVRTSTSGSSWEWLEEAEDYAFLAAPEVEPEAPEAAVPAPTLSAKAIAAQDAAERRQPKDIDISVTNPVDKGKMTVTVPRASLQGRAVTFPTVADVKAAIAAQLGEDAADPASLQIVVSNGGGVYGIRRDTEVVKLDRVLALGVHMAVGVA